MSRIQQLQHWLQQAAQQLQLMVDAIPKLWLRLSEHRKLRAAKQRLQQHMRHGLYCLVPGSAAATLAVTGCLRCGSIQRPAVRPRLFAQS